jgi:hypothetical protein
LYLLQCGALNIRFDRTLANPFLAAHSLESQAEDRPPSMPLRVPPVMEWLLRKVLELDIRDALHVHAAATRTLPPPGLWGADGSPGYQPFGAPRSSLQEKALEAKALLDVATALERPPLVLKHEIGSVLISTLQQQKDAGQKYKPGRSPGLPGLGLEHKQVAKLHIAAMAAPDAVIVPDFTQDERPLEPQEITASEAESLLRFKHTAALLDTLRQRRAQFILWTGFWEERRRRDGEEAERQRQAEAEAEERERQRRAASRAGKRSPAKPVMPLPTGPPAPPPSALGTNGQHLPDPQSMSDPFGGGNPASYLMPRPRIALSATAGDAAPPGTANGRRGSSAQDQGLLSRGDIAGGDLFDADSQQAIAGREGDGSAAGSPARDPRLSAVEEPHDGAMEIMARVELQVTAEHARLAAEAEAAEAEDDEAADAEAGADGRAVHQRRGRINQPGYAPANGRPKSRAQTNAEAHRKQQEAEQEALGVPKVVPIDESPYHNSARIGTFVPQKTFAPTGLVAGYPAGATASSTGVGGKGPASPTGRKKKLSREEEDAWKWANPDVWLMWTPPLTRRLILEPPAYATEWVSEAEALEVNLMPAHMVRSAREATLKAPPPKAATQAPPAFAPSGMGGTAPIAVAGADQPEQELPEGVIPGDDDMYVAYAEGGGLMARAVSARSQSRRAARVRAEEAAAKRAMKERIQDELKRNRTAPAPGDLSASMAARGAQAVSGHSSSHQQPSQHHGGPNPRDPRLQEDRPPAFVPAGVSSGLLASKPLPRVDGSGPGESSGASYFIPSQQEVDDELVSNVLNDPDAPASEQSGAHPGTQSEQQLGGPVAAAATQSLQLSSTVAGSTRRSTAARGDRDTALPTIRGGRKEETVKMSSVVPPWPSPYVIPVGDIKGWDVKRKPMVAEKKVVGNLLPPVAAYTILAQPARTPSIGSRRKSRGPGGRKAPQGTKGPMGLSGRDMRVAPEDMRAATMSMAVNSTLKTGFTVSPEGRNMAFTTMSLEEARNGYPPQSAPWSALMPPGTAMSAGHALNAPPGTAFNGYVPALTDGLAPGGAVLFGSEDASSNNNGMLALTDAPKASPAGQSSFTPLDKLALQHPGALYAPPPPAVQQFIGSPTYLSSLSQYTAAASAAAVVVPQASIVDFRYRLEAIKANILSRIGINGLSGPHAGVGGVSPPLGSTTSSVPPLFPTATGSVYSTASAGSRSDAGQSGQSLVRPSSRGAVALGRALSSAGSVGYSRSAPGSPAPGQQFSFA